jgi:hypothetical protein
VTGTNNSFRTLAGFVITRNGIPIQNPDMSSAISSSTRRGFVMMRYNKLPDDLVPQYRPYLASPEEETEDGVSSPT